MNGGWNQELTCRFFGETLPPPKYWEFMLSVSKCLPSACYVVSTVIRTRDQTLKEKPEN